MGGLCGFGLGQSFFFLFSLAGIFEACSGIRLWPWSELRCGRWTEVFFFNYPGGWPPLEHQRTPAVRLNSWPARHHRAPVCSRFSGFLYFFFFLSLCIFILKLPISHNSFSAESAWVNGQKYPAENSCLLRKKNNNNTDDQIALFIAFSHYFSL